MRASRYPISTATERSRPPMTAAVTRSMRVSGGLMAVISIPLGRGVLSGEHQRAVRSGERRPFRRHDDRGVSLKDDRRAGYALTNRQQLAQELPCWQLEERMLDPPHRERGV